MATTIKIKRGLKTNLPTLAVGEMGYCTDTNELFIGTANGNELINEDSTINELGDIGDVSFTDLAEGDTLVYDGTNWVNDYVAPVTLGVEWDQDTDSLTRLDDAVGLTVTSNPNDGNEFIATSDFDTFPQYQLRRCMVNDDLSINYYIDPDDPTKIGEVVNTGTYTTGGTANYTGLHGQVMVEIPKFWWKYDEPTSDQYQWRISNADQAGYDVHPAFITDGVTKDHIYMGAFEAGLDGTKLKSVSGVELDTGNTIETSRTYAQNRGTGWQMQTYWAINALQILYLIEYADFDSQTTIGQGAVGGLQFDTGNTIVLGNASGMISGTNSLADISYRGVENLWGNSLKYVEGINVNSSREVFISNENFATDVYSGNYTLIGISASTNDFASDILFPHFIAKEVNGSSTSHLHDNYVQSSPRVGLFGGNFNDGTNAGAFYFALFDGSSNSGRDAGSRLQIL